jgi:hypothetical protein
MGYWASSIFQPWPFVVMICISSCAQVNSCGGTIRDVSSKGLSHTKKLPKDSLRHPN